MQSQDNSLTLHTKKTRLGRVKVTSKQGYGLPNPTWIEAADSSNASSPRRSTDSR